MEERVAVHTAARRYCRERAASYLRRLPLWPAAGCQEEAQAIGARHQVLDAILVDIESVTPDDFDSAQELRELLVVAGQTAGDGRIWAPNAASAQGAQEERDRFGAFVRGLTGETLKGVEPLPYRRSLGSAESERIWARLRECWGVRKHQYWHPLIGEDLPPGVVAFQESWFEHAVPHSVLLQILQQHGVMCVWELAESGPEFESDLEEFGPIWGGAEEYWTAGDMGWLLYTSHESSITVAGEWLVAAVKAAWPGWEEHLYTSWNYELPPRGDAR